MTAEKRAALAGIVTIDKEIMHGTPCFTGTRVPVQTLLDFIEAGDCRVGFIVALRAGLKFVTGARISFTLEREEAKGTP